MNTARTVITVIIAILTTATIFSVSATLAINHHAASLKPATMTAPTLRQAQPMQNAGNIRNTANKIVTEPIWIRAHNRDFETFMSTLLNDVERNGGYASTHRVGMAWPPSTRDSISSLVVPQEYAARMEDLRDPNESHITPNYRQWLTESTAQVTLTDRENLVRVSVYGQRQFMPTASHAAAMNSTIWATMISAMLLMFSAYCLLAEVTIGTSSHAPAAKPQMRPRNQRPPF